METPIYMDNMATTPVDPRVLEAMLPHFGPHFGNPSSKTHAFGLAAADAVERARAEVARSIGARPREIVFTAGATEANNLALKGVVATAGPGAHVITSTIEHKAVLDCCRTLEARGAEVTYLPVDTEGQIDVDQLAAAISERTVMVSLMAANNEIGVLQPLAEIGRLTKARGVLWHCDAAQAVAKIELDVEALGIDLLSVSGHKLYAPKGVGFLYVRSRGPRVRLTAQVEGGGQERGLRAGTLNVAGIVALGRACELGCEELPVEAARLLQMRQRLYEGLTTRLGPLVVNGHREARLPGNLNLSFAGIDGAELLAGLREIALSSGAACSSQEQVPSHVLRAIGLSDDLARASLRFGLGRFNTMDEVEYAIKRVAIQVERLRAGEMVAA
ncbi:cysteine desulfurase [bacterium]|nr:cysteine desulfurase [bacterium]